ncbi:MAG: LysR substrate-binding domain-containing protein [Rhizobiaceae bacterium]|nr:LysR substrate-binding domain-containing protein [Rhizobiaceae bacterium]
MLSPLLRFRHLRCFLETARLGSLTAASEALHVSQPAVSKTIQELETILGVQLFDRSGRRLKLTAAGKAYQGRAGAALADLDRAQQLALHPLLQRSKVRIGVLPTAATGLLPRAALAYRETHSQTVLDVMTGPNWLLLSLLRESQLDLVVGRRPPVGNSEGFSFRSLYWERIVPVVRAGHELLQREWNYTDLTLYPLMLPPRGALISTSVRAWLHSVGIVDPPHAYENVSLAFGREVVLNSDTVWFISEGVVRPEIESGILAILPIRNELLGGPVGVTLRENDEPSSETAALIADLEQAALAIGL